MTNIIKIFLFLVIIVSTCYADNLQDSLIIDIEDNNLDHFSLIEAAFIISGITSPDSMNYVLTWYDSIIVDIKNKGLIDEFDQNGSAEKLFLYLHTSFLMEYERKATTLLHIIKNKKYNCVSATILYNFICDDFNLSTMAFETPTHVYTIFTDFSNDLMVENTTSMGFNITKNLKKYSQYMLRYYPEKEIYRIGLHRLYEYENSKGRRISNFELLGLICYNQAFFASKANRYDKAYDYVLLAQKFNQDSRSNLRFEINLYYRWGKKLFNTKEYYQAFEVFADANYRYPDIADFEKNCLFAFIRTQTLNWQTKNWVGTKNLIYEIDELKILYDKELVALENLLVKWGFHFYQQKDKIKALQVIDLLVYLERQNKNIKNLEAVIKSMP